MATSFERMKARREKLGIAAPAPRTAEQTAQTQLHNANLAQSLATKGAPTTVQGTTTSVVNPRTQNTLSFQTGTSPAQPVQRPVTPAPVSNTGITAPTAQTDAERALFIKLNKGDTLNDEDYGTLYDIQKKRQQTFIDESKAGSDAIAAKQREAIVAEEARVKAREEELRKTTEGRVQLYKEAQEAQGALEKQRAERTANENLATSERLLGARGNLTSAVGYQNARDLENERAATLNAIDSRVAAQVALYEAQLQGADDETLKEMNKRVNELYDAEQEAILTAETNLQNLKLTAQQQGDTDLMALVAKQQENLTKKKTETNYNENVTLLKNDGYLYDEAGRRLKDAAGNEMEYDKQNGIIISGGKIYKVGENGLELVSDSETTEESPWEKVTFNGVDYEVNKVTNEKRIPETPTTPTDDKVARAQSVIAKIDNLLANDDWKKGVGPVDAAMPGWTSGKRNAARANIEELISSIALENLNLLKGPMSDRDIQFIKDASAGLRLDMSEQAFKSQLERIKNKFVEVTSKTILNTPEKKAAYDDYIKEGASESEALQLTKEEFPSFNTAVSAASTNSGTASKPLVVAKSPIDPNTKHDAECVVYSRMFAPNLPRIAWSDTSKAKNAEYKRNVINTTTPEVGAVAIMPTVGFYGHTANVIAKNPDGTITIQEANYKDGKVTRRTGTPEELKIEGYFYDGVTKPIV